jgi:hypothetical protein
VGLKVEYTSQVFRLRRDWIPDLSIAGGGQEAAGSDFKAPLTRWARSTLGFKLDSSAIVLLVSCGADSAAMSTTTVWSFVGIVMVEEH